MEGIKKALVTGASSGIGEAIVQMLLEEGVEVYGIGRNFKESGLNEKENFHQICCDLKDSRALKECIGAINKNHDIDLFASSAGCGYYGLHEELNSEKIHELVAVNLEAPMLITNLLLRDMKKNKGTLVFISSVTATGLNPHGCAYGATKAGLDSFVHSLFAECRKYGVRIINIRPDMTMTNLYRNADFECSDEQGAFLTPDDVAGGVMNAIKQRDGVVCIDLTLVPQIGKIKRKVKDAK